MQSSRHSACSPVECESVNVSAPQPATSPTTTASVAYVTRSPWKNDATRDGSITREQMMERYADEWRQLDPQTFPFIYHIVDEFAVHNDREQFLAGLDLLLAGLRLQTEQ